MLLCRIDPVFKSHETTHACKISISALLSAARICICIKTRANMYRNASQAS